LSCKPRTQADQGRLSYTDPVTREIAESCSFRGTDVLKVQQLASNAYRSIATMREQDKVAKA